MTNCLTSLESFSKIFEIFDAQIILSHFVITRYIFCDVYIYVHTKKTDLYVDRMITTDQGKRLASSWNAAFLETSAKQNEVSTNTFAIVPC
jgi:Ras family protein